MIKYDYQKFDLLFFYYYCRYSIAVKWLFRMLQMRPCGIDKYVLIGHQTKNLTYIGSKQKRL
jgi:hypothetical protein